MAEQRIIPTRTTINISGLDIDIFNEYFELDLPYTIQSRISEGVGSQEGTSYIEGELLIKMIDEFFPTEIDYFLNEDGTLTVKSESGDVNQYSIDEEGFLIYNELEELTIGALDDFGFETAYPWGTGDINLDRTNKVISPVNSGTGAGRFFMENHSPFLNEEGEIINGASNGSFIDMFAINVTSLLQNNKRNTFKLFLKSVGVATGGNERLVLILRAKEPNEDVYGFTYPSPPSQKFTIDTENILYTTDWKETSQIFDVVDKSETADYVLFLGCYRANATPVSAFENLEIFFDDFSVEYQDL